MKRILVADDSVTIQKVIALTFADEPFEVQSVGTGAEALELVKSWKPDIVLADVIMPQMNGYELCRAVRQLDATNPTPVLLLAGTFEAFDEEEARSVGASDFITKPFESGELIEKVKALIGGAAAAPPAETAPSETEIPAPPAPSPVPAAPPQAEPPAAAGKASEPDIWDILSDSGDYAQPQEGTGGAASPGFGPIEGAGVVDVGSFDVGLGRPESPPPAVSEVPPATQESPVQGMPQAGDMPPVAEDHSRVENMERDFFGFDTGAVEEVPAADIPYDAVEEVTFEMEQPEAEPEPDAREVSFVVPEPAPDQDFMTGETISPQIMAPETSAAPASDSPAPFDMMSQPAPEPPLELSVDLAQDLPEEFSPEPARDEELQIPAAPVPEPVLEPPPAPVSEPAAPEATAEPSPAAPGVPDEEAIRKMVEEKIEKIVWEVVPEMAEVMIREVIQKIKDGS